MADEQVVWIYHERQEALLCGQHALNNLAQAPIFTVAQLTEIAWELDQLEQSVLTSSAVVRQPSANVDESGNYSIQVLKQALQEEFGIHLEHLNVMLSSSSSSSDVTELQGFLCHKSDHWFAIRQIGGRFWNLNSMLERPTIVSHFSIGTEIQNLWQNQGYTVYGIRSGLPTAGSGDFSSSGSGGTWHKMSDLLQGKSTEKDPWDGLSGKGMRLGASGSGGGGRSITNGSNNGIMMDGAGGGLDVAMSEDEQELQRALEASLETAIAEHQLEHWKRLAVPDVEPSAGTKGSVRLQLKLPDGSRVVRRFLESDSVEILYAFVYQRGENNNGHQQHRLFELRYGFPPKDLQPLVSQTIGQANLAGETIQGRYL